eukprot:SM000074S21694  [mRNA]  locus=s74:449881:450832:- [translate_table: standard]
MFYRQGSRRPWHGECYLGSERGARWLPSDSPLHAPPLQKHLPGFIKHADELKAAGVDTIACVAVNDAFVMRAWGESLGTSDKVTLAVKGPVPRGRRFSLLAEDGVVKTLNLEEGGAFTVSGADGILKTLQTASASA